MDHTRTCQHCHRPLSPFARADSLYCSGRCRVAAHRVHHAGSSPSVRCPECGQPTIDVRRYSGNCAGDVLYVHGENSRLAGIVEIEHGCYVKNPDRTDDQRAGFSPIPAALRARDRWVRHDAAKRPLTVQGRGASSTNARTWSTYTAASAANDVGNGLGFVLTGEGIACIDLDECLTDDGLAPWAAAIVASCPDTYVERSPGGRGVHVWGLAKLPHGRVVHVDGGKVELYGGPGRYITVTGRPYANAPSHLADLSGVIAQVLGT